MDGLERRYKVRLRKKYEEDIKESDHVINIASIGLVISLGFSAIFLSLGLAPISIALCEGLPIFLNIRSLVSSIIEKTVLQTKIEDINVALDLTNADTNEESVGRRR